MVLDAEMLTKIATLDFFFTIFLSFELTNRVLPHGWAWELYNCCSPSSRHAPIDGAGRSWPTFSEALR